VSVESRDRNPKDISHIAGRRAIGEQSDCCPLLLCGEQARATANPATPSSGLQARHCAFTHQAALDRAKRGEDRENRVPFGTARVQRLGQRPETNATGFKGLDRLDQMTKAAAQPVQFPDDNNIAGPGEVERFPHPRTIHASARRPVAKNALASVLAQRIHLKVKVLIGSRDTSVSDEHWFSLVIETRQRISQPEGNYEN
jgi:hypothetical protein